jgi:hypothetical protein
MKTLIFSGNYIETSYFAVNGCMAVKIGLDKSKKGDKTEVVFEDGLYKAYKNGLLKMAATNCLIEIRNRE